MTNSDTGIPRPLLRRDDALAALEEAARWWGCDVPEDPGAGELAELVQELVGRLRADQLDERSLSAAREMAKVAAALGAVSRLGGLLPAVSLWHLRAAVEKEQQARGRFARTAIPQPDGIARSVAPVS
ncbi:hypothetical protein MHW47_05940 [Streptomyces sp. OfavH-34-F]|uniref:hypothetical protein n=1 Tax=Streptomyces sp. OfavH-34-F TaxID=2917760 RepID=UPI001EF290C3|nr:hypothetical protein [Streptomyces sp. OfavH-34-F]MCG7523982.1 hypothetical protein [Streptomyces sp. OfavH-34-F]